MKYIICCLLFFLDYHKKNKYRINKKLKNYIKLKEKFTGNYFPWYFNNNVAREEFNTEDNVFYFGHTLYTRPEVSGYSQPASENFQLAFSTMQEILTENNYDFLLDLYIF